MKKVSPRTVARALLYIRCLENLIKEKQDLVSSRQLAAIAGLSDVQIRKDISHVGKVGTPKVGYKTAELRNVLEDFVLQHNVVHLVVFGVGNLGSAILKYPGFHRDRIKIVAAFDVVRRKIGRVIGGVTVYPLKRASEIVSTMHADIGIIAVPEACTQAVADLMVKAGLKGIVNFSPVSINVPKKVAVKNIDLSIEFLALFCDTLNGQA